MKIYQDYLFKRAYYKSLLEEFPESDLQNIIVIPSYNEPSITKTLDSLFNCIKPKFPVEVIIVVNSPKNCSSSILEQNKKTLEEINLWKANYDTTYLKVNVLDLKNIPVKKAGVGYARKVGMDEAIRRFNLIKNKNGFITSLDADTFVSKNYLIELENLFLSPKKCSACSVYFEHPISGDEFSELVYEKIIEYELYLRYYTQSLKLIGFPYHFFTIGSAFSVKAEIYCKQGGMNSKQAGEDFYFLQKIMLLGNYFYLNSCTVYPSPRPSNRVPFGTGPAIQAMIEQANQEYLTYDFDAFLNLRSFFSRISELYGNSNYSKNLKDLHPSLIEFLDENNFEKALAEINGNTSNLKTFLKRFFVWFDAFRIIKYLNFAHQKHYTKISVQKAVAKYFGLIEFTVKQPVKSKDMLKILRKREIIDSQIKK